MLGILVIIACSWALLYFMEKENITVIGILPNLKHISQFLIGVILIVLVNLLWVYIDSISRAVKWGINPTIKYQSIFEAFIYHFRSALTEDLVFRGAILYILIHKIGANKAILISTLSFGVYHVFSYGMTGDRIIPIVYVTLVTGFTGYVWAYTYYKTKSIALGFGLHLGTNLLLSCFYPAQPYGELLFIELSRVHLTDWASLYFSIVKGFFPSILTLIFVRLLLKSNIRIFKANYESTII